MQKYNDIGWLDSLLNDFVLCLLWIEYLQFFVHNLKEKLFIVYKS